MLTVNNSHNVKYLKCHFGKSSIQEMVNFRDYPGLIRRPGDTVQNLESPGSLGGVDTTVLR